jgi:hypothetical protein
MLIEFVYIAHAHISDFLKGEQGDLDNLGTYIRIWHHKKRSRFQLSRTTSSTHGKCPIACVFFPQLCNSPHIRTFEDLIYFGVNMNVHMD